ncbi:MAG: hypothetical protein EOO51_04615 [Flavobacterium sp.]|nr:MAG: hypothetical protein EOO51_04615 [Flavobacterium sp.]
MRVFFSLFIVVHGLMHLRGSARAFLAVNGDHPRISSAKGVLWTFVAVLFFITAAMVLRSLQYWWIFSTVAIVCSQYLIIDDWKISKSGTLVNIVILAISVIVFLSFRKIRL